MTGRTTAERALAWAHARSIGRGDPLAVAIQPAGGGGIGLASGSDELAIEALAPTAVLAEIEAAIGPRWVWWDRTTADVVVAAGVEVARCWDVLTVDRLLRGGWRTSVGEAWAALHDLAIDDLPAMGQLDLLRPPADEGDDRDNPIRPDGHLRPEWTSGAWSSSPSRLATWARVAWRAHELQRSALGGRPDPGRALSTAHAESLADLLCAELTASGLPLDEREAARIIDAAIGPRPDGAADEIDARRRRDAVVLAHIPAGPIVDLRNPADVKAMLRRVSIDVPDTRAWRLEQLRDAHPLVDALLAWRKAERLATTYGYRWLDAHVRDGRLLGEWSSSDGAAGRMTATAGLHNLPAELRPAVRADPGHRLVRADLGQIEPRVLASLSGDPALIAATASDDLYRPVAERLAVDRGVAKVAVLGAMYGATTGESAHALRRLEREYPTAMDFLERAAEAGRRGDDLISVGGRLIPIWVRDDGDGDIDRARRAAAARGRYARNALIQGAAAELFKMWAAIVRLRCREFGAQIVLCLHDELLVHTPEPAAETVADTVTAALDECAYRWSAASGVRFTVDVSIVERWSDAAH